MKITRVVLRLSIILAVVASGLGLVGASLIGLSVYLNSSLSVMPGNDPLLSNPVRFQTQADEPSVAARNRRALPTLTPTAQKRKTITPAPTAAGPTPTAQATSSEGSLLLENGPDGAEAVRLESKHVSTDSLSLSPAETLTSQVKWGTRSNTPGPASSDASSGMTLEATPGVEETVQFVEPYTSTVQVHPPPSAASGLDTGATSRCPMTSEAVFDLIPIEGQPLSDHPDSRHADLNLALRGHTVVSETLALTFYNGDTDPNAPQLSGLFDSNRGPRISAVYQVNEWRWDTGSCEGDPRGCRGGPIAEYWPVTMVGLAVTAGEPIYIPERAPEIYRSGYVGMVLYAEEKRITLGYTRQDNVAAGYTIHLEGLCIDPNLLALYRAQRDADGWRTSNFLPALRNNQALGTALGPEIQVVVRDAGRFMDPRSQKDWWQ